MRGAHLHHALGTSQVRASGPDSGLDRGVGSDHISGALGAHLDHLEPGPPQGRGQGPEPVYYPDFPLTLARWPMASEHWRWTSDFLSYWPGLPSGISTIVKNFKKNKNWIVFLKKSPDLQKSQEKGHVALYWTNHRPKFTMKSHFWWHFLFVPLHLKSIPLRILLK